MKVLISENVTLFHEVTMSDELDVETVLTKANQLKKRCDTGGDAIKIILGTYKNKFGEYYDYKIVTYSSEFDELICESIVD